MLKSTLRGFTIIELAISVAVLSVVAGIFAPVIGQGIDAILITRSKEQLAQEAHLAMSWITEDLKNNCSYISSVWHSDTDMAGILFYTASGYPNYIFYFAQINYVYPSPTYGKIELVRRVAIAGVSQTDTVLTSPIRFFRVKGYSAVGSATGNEIPNCYWGAWSSYPTSPTNLADVKIIQIYLSVGDDQNHYDLMTAIHPRLIP